MANKEFAAVIKPQLPVAWTMFCIARKVNHIFIQNTHYCAIYETFCMIFLWIDLKWIIIWKLLTLQYEFIVDALLGSETIDKLR